MNKIPIIIDTDPGIDDALALAIAFNLDYLDIKLITSVAGNIPIDTTTKNALDLVALFNKEIPVAKGQSKPIRRELISASNIHGNNGLGNVEIPSSSKSILPTNALDSMVDVLESSDDKVTLCTLGPLTNIALLIQEYPNLLNKIDKIIMMGGGIGLGNITSTSEFNFFVDPEAVDIVFNSGIDLVMIGLNATNKAILKDKELSILKDGNNKQRALYEMFSYYQDGDFTKGLAMHDVAVFAYIDNPSMFDMHRIKVGVSCDDLTRGATFYSKHTEYEGVILNVALDLNTESFVEWIVPLLQAL